MLINKCDRPIGVQLKITALDKSDEPLATRELWPASVRNIPIGEYTFSIDQWIEYEPGIKSITIEPVDVRAW